MKIKSVTTAVIEANYDWTMIRIEAEDGTFGLGESFCAPGLTATIKDIAVLLEGADVRNIEALTRTLRLATVHAAAGGGHVHHAISGIECALWDLNARALGVPLWRLLGGRFRDRVRIYADCHAGNALQSYSSVLVSRRPSWAPATEEHVDELHWAPAEIEGVYTPEAYAARAKEMAGRGFTALKFDLDLPLLPGEDVHARTISPAQLHRQVELARAACSAVPDVQVAFDCHWRYSPGDALRLARALEDVPVLWLEDPVPPHLIDTLAAVTPRTTTPIATGENHYLLEGFAPMIQRGAVDVVAPDVQKVGGLAETRRIAALADAYSLPVAPHNIAGPVGTIAAAHVCASIPNFLALEWHAAGVPFFDDLVTGFDGPIIRRGWITLPEAPGLGIDLNLDACRRFARQDEPFFA